MHCFYTHQLFLQATKLPVCQYLIHSMNPSELPEDSHMPKENSKLTFLCKNPNS